MRVLEKAGAASAGCIIAATRTTATRKTCCPINELRQNEHTNFLKAPSTNGRRTPPSPLASSRRILSTKGLLLESLKN
jgi:hypothetical protein